MASEDPGIQTWNSPSVVPGSRSERGFSKRETLASTTIGLSSLPREVRKRIYRQVLTLAQPLLLFQDGGSRVEAFVPGKPRQWLALLHANQQINKDASAVLYSSNRFILVDTTRKQVDLLQSFLDGIGPANAGSLSHLCINFPVIEGVEDQPGKFKLRDDSLWSFKLLQAKCTNLTILETFIHNQNSSDLTKTDQDDPGFVREALSQIGAQLNAIRSLSKLIVRVYGGTLSPSVMASMQVLNWVVVRGDAKPPESAGSIKT